MINYTFSISAWMHLNNKQIKYYKHIDKSILSFQYADDSEIKTIDEYSFSFYFTKLERIKISSQLTKIEKKKNAFSY